MKYEYDQDAITKMDSYDSLEWMMATGTGGYVSGSIKGNHSRKHHGLLVGSKEMPIDRILGLVKMEEILFLGENDFHFGIQESSLPATKTHSFPVRFTWDGTVSYQYQIGETIVIKTIAPDYGHNAVAIYYEVMSGKSSVRLALVPVFNLRPHGSILAEDELFLEFQLAGNVIQVDSKPSQNLPLFLHIEDGEWEKNPIDRTDPYRYRYDEATGDPRTESHYTPYITYIELDTNATRSISVVAAFSELPKISASEIIENYRLHIQKIIDQSSFQDTLGKRLVVAADQFIAHRNSTGEKTILAGFPWFTDWGRDTMIAFEGLLLTTKRFEEAKSVLISFAKYEKNGLIPNMFPDSGSAPLYNTADASLWYIHAIYRYYESTEDDQFIREHLFQTMENIVRAYANGTDFHIRMDSDFLIHAGSGLDQVTWMDVRINGEVITPRHGKPVEINALWYNSLQIMAIFAQKFGKNKQYYRTLAAKVRKQFLKRFWNPKAGCLYDVIGPKDGSIRPNQLYALALPFPLVQGKKAKKIVAVAKAQLVDIYGIRSLSKADPRFVKRYEGDLWNRDHAYHMGTSWGFLFGIYLEAYLQAYKQSEAARNYVYQEMKRMADHLESGCLNGYAEIFDGMDGIITKGCYTQAWSVGEFLRVYKQYAIDRIGVIGE